MPDVLPSSPPPQQEASNAATAHRAYAALFEEFPDLGTGTVLRCITAAAQAVEMFGETADANCPLVARIARAELEQVRSGEDSGARVFGVRQPRKRE
jgi:hypothetical protein